ncbi:MAG: glycosyltransferase family 9 protein [Desulfovibrio sp.]|jgi:ADP-heptose:LPS heptosyltransferase|nr:glycosyltransferase family 9 protein [Desulfovibrio sp.]
MRRVLVFQLARFGDLIQTKRLLLSVLAEDGRELHLCLDESLAALARLLYPRAILHTLPAHRGARSPEAVMAAARRTFAALRALVFEDVYFLNFSPLSFACASLFDADQCRGYARVNGQDMSGRWPSISFNLMADRRFSPLNLADLWALLHPSPVAPETVNPIPRASGRQRIGVVMAGRESRRSLPPPVLANCVQAIFQARGGPEIVCIGSKSEGALARRLRRELPAQTVEKTADLTGKTALTDLPELLQSLDLLVTPDTGAMHLAAHLGTPVQAFFLSSAWCWETGPYGFGHTVWQALPPCSPCLESAPCPNKTVCLSPFAEAGFLAHLAGRRGESWPEGLIGCVSMLDDMGVTYKNVDGGDPYQDARRELRSGLSAHFGADGSVTPFMRQDLAEYLYTEKNWMLPPNWTKG